MSTPMPVREWRDVSATTFRNEILPAQQPALIRGAVRSWPAVRAATSPQALANYLRRFDTGASAETMHGEPAIGGRFLYNDDLSGLNFQRNSMPFGRALDRLLELLDLPAPPALYVGALAVPAALPGFAQQNPLVLADGIVPRVWLSNRVTVHLQHRLRGRRPAPIHAVPPGATREPVRRPARIHARRSAHQHGAARRA